MATYATILLHALWYIIVISLYPLSLFSLVPREVVLFFVLLTFLVWTIFKGCPLRILENYFRSNYGPESVYSVPFTKHYLEKIFSIKVSLISVRIILWTALLGLLVISAPVLFEKPL
jgi:hypothetical protein